MRLTFTIDIDPAELMQAANNAAHSKVTDELFKKVKSKNDELNGNMPDNLRTALTNIPGPDGRFAFHPVTGKPLRNFKPKQCAKCGITFTPTGSTQEYCSEACGGKPKVLPRHAHHKASKKKIKKFTPDYKVEPTLVKNNPPKIKSAEDTGREVFAITQEEIERAQPHAYSSEEK